MGSDAGTGSDGGAGTDGNGIDANGGVDSGIVIDAGSDGGLACLAPLTACGDVCADLETDESHCGFCNTPCAFGVSCVGFRCEEGPMCAVTQTLCSGICTDTSRDAVHCGGCDMPCDVGQICEGSLCLDGGAGESCSEPISLSGTPASTTVYLTGRSANHTPLTCSSGPNPDVVLMWTAPTSGMFVFTADGGGASVDVVLGVFSDSPCTSAYELGCDDDGGLNLGSRVVVDNVFGSSRYYIVVASYSSTPPTLPVTVAVTSAL